MLITEELPFTEFELSIRWARNAIRAESILSRMARPEVPLPLVVTDLARTAREVLDGEGGSAACCHHLTAEAWQVVHISWGSLVDDPTSARRAVFSRFANASYGAATDWCHTASEREARAHVA